MRHLARRLAQIVPTMLGALVLVFLVMRVLPGDPAIALLGTAATPDAVAALRRELGVDRPLLQQFVAYLSGALRLDLGRSLSLRAPVTRLVLDAVPHTLLLTVGGTLVAVAIGVPLGAAAALGRGRWLDYAASTGALLGVSVPVFVWGLLLLLAFSLHWRLFPTAGAGSTPLAAARALVLPSVATGVFLAGVVSRITRSSVLHMLPPHRARQGTGRAGGRRPPRAPERDHPHPDRDRAERRHAAERCRGGRDGLHPARHRPARAGGDPGPRLPGDPGRDPRLGPGGRHAGPGHRRALRPGRSAGARDVSAVSSPAAAAPRRLPAGGPGAAAPGGRRAGIRRALPRQPAVRVSALFILLVLATAAAAPALPVPS